MPCTPSAIAHTLLSPVKALDVCAGWRGRWWPATATPSSTTAAAGRAAAAAATVTAAAFVRFFVAIEAVTKDEALRANLAHKVPLVLVFCPNVLVQIACIQKKKLRQKQRTSPGGGRGQ